MTTVYLAGPMTRRPHFNFPAFDDAAERWRTLGFDVISPAEHDRANGFDPTGLTGHEDLSELGFDLRKALLWDLEQVANAEGLILLEGWETSRGARAELSLAAALGKWAIVDGMGREPVPAEVFLRPSPAPSSGDGEVRVTNATTGAQKGSKLARFDLIPAHALTELAEHFGRGASKYEDRNWERGYDWHLSFAAMMRHAWAFWNGEDRDPETGSKHVIAAAWHGFVLATFMDTHPELDTRPRRAK